MDREKLDGWCEKGILALVLAVLVFSPLALGAVKTWQWLVVEGLSAGVLGLWIARLWISQRPQILWPPICWAVLAFVAYAGVRYFQADVEYVARREVIRVLVYAFLFFAILNNLHRQESTQALALTPVFLGMVIAVYACWQFVRKSDIVWNLHSNYHGRGSGTFIYPNSLSAYLEMLAPVALGYALSGRLPHMAKILAGYAGAVMVAGICVSLSRGGLAVAGTVLAILAIALLFQRDYRLHGLALAIVLTVAGIVVTPKLETTGRLLAAGQNGRAPDDMRFAIWQAGLEIWRDNFWLGAGPAHFDQVYRRYRPAIDQLDPDRVHNDYLNVLVDWGLIGGGGVTAAWVFLGAGVAKTWKHLQGTRNDFARKKSNKFALLIGGSAGLLAILLHSFVDFNLHVPAIAILMVMLMALLSSQLRFATERYWRSLGIGLKSLVTIFLAGGIATLNYAGQRGAREDYWLGQAALKPDFSAEQQAALEKAFAIERKNSETTWQIAECLRTRSFLNESENPDSLARQAIEWYRRGIALDPYDPNNWSGCGRCLDWINAGDVASAAEASKDYERADALDPNGCFTAALIGRHYAQLGDYAAARSWFERSLRLKSKDNELPAQYLASVEHWLTEGAAKQRPPGTPAGTPGTPEPGPK